MQSNALYQELDAITGGLPAFLARQRDESWTLGSYEPFNLTAWGPDEVLFGFRVRINHESCPDPQLRARVDLAAKTAFLVAVDTLTGYYQGTDIPGGSDTYATELLVEMQRRRAVYGDDLVVCAVDHADVAA